MKPFEVQRYCSAKSSITYNIDDMYFDAGCTSLLRALHMERGGRLSMNLSLGSYLSASRTIQLRQDRTRTAPRFQDPCPDSPSKSVGVKPILQGTVASSRYRVPTEYNHASSDVRVGRAVACRSKRLSYAAEHGTRVMRSHTLRAHHSSSK